MHGSTYALLQILADGKLHSGESLGHALSMSRSAIWKHFRTLEEYGIVVESHRGKGYQLRSPVNLLNKAKIEKSLSGEVKEHIEDRLYIHEEIDSTNGFLISQFTEHGCAHPGVCLAEYQRQGRGRRGRIWQSPYGSNVCLSMGWLFGQGAVATEGLSLAVGVVICHALERLGYAGLSLKWPNDIFYENKKLGGILIEINGDLSGDCYVVVGIGLNVSMSKFLPDTIDQEWIDLAQIKNNGLDRNLLCAHIINELFFLLEDYENTGFSPFVNAWESLNAYMGKTVMITSSSETITGKMLGIDHSGSLRLLVDGREKRFLGGEISVRAKS